MSWITVLWSKNAAACSTLAALCLDKVRRTLDGAIEKGQDNEGKSPVSCAEGNVQWISAHGRRHPDEHRNPSGLADFERDLADRKEPDFAARQQRDEPGKPGQQETAPREKQIADCSRLEREVVESCTREQRRIAYDLHDGVGQQLVSIALSAKLLEEKLRPERPVDAEKAFAIVQLANEAARQIRLMAHSFEGADGVGDLRTALESLAMSISQNCRVKGLVKANGSALTISEPVSAQLYRIAQEAARNAIEHGGARHVLIQLTFGDRDMILTIQDDGSGFEPKTNGRGMGLRIMRYRAQCIGGSFEVHAGPTRGTIVECRVPLEAKHFVPVIK